MSNPIPYKTMDVITYLIGIMSIKQAHVDDLGLIWLQI